MKNKKTEPCVYKEGPFCYIKVHDRPTEDQCLACDQYRGKSRGLGDDLTRFFKWTGLDKLVPQKKRGKGCGCAKRRKKLNKMFPKESQNGG